MKARDAGGSMVIHAFGAYYGLSISWMLYRPNLDQSSRLQGSHYHSDVFAMIGEFNLKESCTHNICFWLKFIFLLLQILLTSLIIYSVLQFTGFFDLLPPLTPPFLHRHPLPVDVLAQLQLSHCKPWRWATQSSHQHLPVFGCICSHYCGHIKPLPQAGKTRHGNKLCLSFTNTETHHKVALLHMNNIVN